MRQCQASEVQAANNAKPACEPRPTIEYLQDPNDLRRGSTLHPDQILVQKCSGSCLDNNMYQSCIASRKQSKTIQVRFFFPSRNNTLNFRESYKTRKLRKCQVN